MLNSLTQRLANRFTNSQLARRHPKITNGTQLSLETLECRALLTTFLVNTVIDNPLATAADQDGFVSLREAIMAANTNATFGDATTPGQGGGVVDEITFDASLTGQTIVLGGEQLVISDHLSISGLGKDQLVVSGNYPSAVSEGRILSVDSGVTFGLSDATISGGNTLGSGGGIYNRGITTIRNAIVYGNVGHGAGGIFNTGTLSLEGSTVSNNVATDGSGGGISNTGTLVVIDSLLLNNESRTVDNGLADGGGIFNDGTLTVTSSTFADNSAGRAGGGIRNSGNAVIVSSSFIRNAGLSGGAIAAGGLNTHVSASTIHSNVASASGGGISIGSSVLTISGSTISGNSAGEDGGGIAMIFNPRFPSGTLELSNSTVTGNRADSDGNTTGIGGGILVGTDHLAVLNNSLIAGNLAGGAGSDSPDDVSGDSARLTGAHNLIGDAATSGGLSDGVNGNIVGNAGMGTIDLTFVIDTTLADNGGPTLTHALLPGSLAVDAGDNGLVIDATDQRGENRIADGDQNGTATVDIGAVEVQAATQLIEIDVKPGSDPNSINLASNAVIAVTIFTTADFDAAKVNVNTVVWAGANVALKNNGSFISVLEDVDGDGELDLVLHFRLADTNLLDIYEDLLRDDLADGTLDSYRQSVDIALVGLTNDGTLFQGVDRVDLLLTGRNLRDFRNERVI